MAGYFVTQNPGPSSTALYLHFFAATVPCPCFNIADVVYPFIHVETAKRQQYARIVINPRNKDAL